jgi:hypothetical protein
MPSLPEMADSAEMQRVKKREKEKNVDSIVGGGSAVPPRLA